MERQPEFSRSEMPLDNEQELLRRIAALNLSPCESRILGALRGEQLAGGGVPRFVVSRSRLAEIVQANLGTVSDACRKLQQRGLLSIRRTGRQNVFVVDWLRVFDGNLTPVPLSAPRRQPDPISPRLAPGQQELPFPGDGLLCWRHGIWRIELTTTGYRVIRESDGFVVCEWNQADIAPTSGQHRADTSHKSTSPPDIGVTSGQHRPDTSRTVVTPPDIAPTTARQQEPAPHEHDHEMNEMNEGKKEVKKQAVRDHGSWELDVKSGELTTLNGINGVVARYRAAGRIEDADADDFQAFLRAANRRSRGECLPDEQRLLKPVGAFVRGCVIKGNWRRNIRSQDRQWVADQSSNHPISVDTQPAAPPAEVMNDDIKKRQATAYERLRSRLMGVGS